MGSAGEERRLSVRELRGYRRSLQCLLCLEGRAEAVLLPHRDICCEVLFRLWDRYLENLYVELAFASRVGELAGPGDVALDSCSPTFGIHSIFRALLA